MCQENKSNGCTFEDYKIDLWVSKTRTICQNPAASYCAKWHTFKCSSGLSSVTTGQTAGLTASGSKAKPNKKDDHASITTEYEIELTFKFQTAHISPFTDPSTLNFLNLQYQLLP